MVGYDTEDKAYCMELTYNYGLKSYEPGNGLQEFGLFCSDVAAAKKAAADLKYKVEGDVITGPDQYKFRVLQQPEGRQERFSYVLCRTGDVKRKVSFYKDFLGFSDAPNFACAFASYSPQIIPINSDIMLRWYQGGRNVCSIVIQRGGKITKSATATPGVSDWHVSTV